MPRSKAIVLTAALLLFAGADVKASDPPGPTRATFVSRFTFIYGERPLDVLSPDKSLRLHAWYPFENPNSPSAGLDNLRMAVYQRGRKTPIPVTFKGEIEAPTGFLWSPTSQAFLMLDEQGSAEGGMLRVFVRQGSGFADDASFQRAAVRLYQSTNHCRRGTIDPVVTPIDWTADGKSFYAYAQATIQHRCGDPDKYIVMEMDLAGGAITHIYTPQEAARIFPKGTLP